MPTHQKLGGGDPLLDKSEVSSFCPRVAAVSNSKAALRMQAEFEIIVWRSLATAPPLDELLASLLKFLMPLQGEDPIFPTTIGDKFSKLMQFLQSRRCLLVLDNAEIILHREQQELSQISHIFV